LLSFTTAPTTFISGVTLHPIRFILFMPISHTVVYV